MTPQQALAKAQSLEEVAAEAIGKANEYRALAHEGFRSAVDALNALDSTIVE